MSGMRCEMNQCRDQSYKIRINRMESGITLCGAL